MDHYLVPSGITDITNLNPENIERMMDQVDEEEEQGGKF
jgi:hypothetical protein